MRQRLLIVAFLAQVGVPAWAGDPGWNGRGEHADAVQAARALLRQSGLARVTHGPRFSRGPVAGDAERMIPGLKQAASDVRAAAAKLAQASTHARVIDFGNERGRTLDRLVNFMDGDTRIGYLRVALTREDDTIQPGLRQRKARSEIFLEDRAGEGSGERDRSAIVHIIDHEERVGSHRSGELIVNLLLDRGPERDLLHERHTFTRKPGGKKRWDAQVEGSANRGQSSDESIKYTRLLGPSDAKQ